MRTKVIPNAFTLTNLLLGFISLIYTMNSQYHLAAIMILVSMILDGMDGKIARRLDVSSPFGKELDSLADLVSFGVAPAILAYAAALQQDLGVVGLMIAILFALCGAVRLARFNVLNITTHFVGVPITFAGSLMAAVILMSQRLPWLPFWFVAVVMISMAGLMVSKIKVPKY